ncbi:ribokinase [Maribellus comscasis]|uniref:Ribokinase n=1 Tax=Maribellus comscasis TaxID=2681766 RepID=A0A6I6JVP0_9BACT|nr:ribokinase [Maribellus comscasis]QGY47225.1 ribokinase [Maribellus comscasis]
MSQNKILVIGSSNTDMVVRTDKFPDAGETILGGEFFMNAGGKGANQAVAARRLGGNVEFIGKTGKDIFGQQALEYLRNEGIFTGNILTDDENPSGVALITVNGKGENSIVVAAGANGTLVPGDLEKIPEVFNDASMVLLQLEIPLETVVHVSKLSLSLKKKVILNPAPAQMLPDALLQGLYLITPNETEVKQLTGIEVYDIESAAKASQVLIDKGVQNVIITMGAAGAFIYSAEFTGLVEAPKVKAVDTTAAGDTFNGALTVFLSEGMGIKEATRLACIAASISVTRIGAQTSVPFRRELHL